MRPPDYGSGSLAEVMPSAASAMGVPGFTNSLSIGECRSAVVLLVDGLGDLLIQNNAESAPQLADMRARSGRRIDSAFPSTTPVGLGSLGTGLPPGAHGFVGATFELPETGRILAPLGWRDEPSPIATQPEPTVLERVARSGVRVACVAPREFEATGLTRATLRGGNYHGADTLGERVGEIAGLLRGEPSLVYSYWGHLDRTGHVHGIDSDHWRAELRHVELLVEQISSTLQPGDVLIVTADHGMVDCAPDETTWIDDDEHLQAGVAALGGEPRMRHVYARPGAARDVEQAWATQLDGIADVLSRDRAIATGLFGKVETGLESRIGDVIAIARDHKLIGSRRVDSIISGLRGQHGSVTDDEVAIPLICLRG